MACLLPSNMSMPLNKPSRLILCFSLSFWSSGHRPLGPGVLVQQHGPPHGSERRGPTDCAQRPAVYHQPVPPLWKLPARSLLSGLCGRNRCCLFSYSSKVQNLQWRDCKRRIWKHVCVSCLWVLGPAVCLCPRSICYLFWTGRRGNNLFPMLVEKRKQVISPEAVQLLQAAFGGWLASLSPHPHPIVKWRPSHIFSLCFTEISCLFSTRCVLIYQ